MVTIFSLASIFTGTIAWFMIKNETSVSGAQFKVMVKSGTVRGISVHSYLGLNGTENSYCFNPIGETVYDQSGGHEADPVLLNGYDPMSPSHPILMIFSVAGAYSNIRFKTDYCFLGNTDKNITITGTYATNAALQTAASSFTNAQDGKCYKVTTDEDHGDNETIYKYHSDKSELEMVFFKLKSTDNPLSSAVKFNWMRFKNTSETIANTYATYAALIAAGVNVPANNGKYYKVRADENIGNGETVYKYDSTAGKFLLAWDYIDNSGTAYPMTSVDTVKIERYDSVNKEYDTPRTTSNVSTVSLKKSILDINNESSFCIFDTNIPTFENEVSVFDHSLDGAQFVAVSIDYNSDAIEYICSIYLGHDYIMSGFSFHCDWTTII